MTAAELDRIKAARDRNRAAMAKEAEEASTRKAEREAYEAAAPERAAKAAAMMVAMVDLVTSCHGRPLPQASLARLKEIRLRNAIMADVAARCSRAAFFEKEPK
jgi:hypothetical protein